MDEKSKTKYTEAAAELKAKYVVAKATYEKSKSAATLGPAAVEAVTPVAAAAGSSVHVPRFAKAAESAVGELE